MDYQDRPSPNIGVRLRPATVTDCQRVHKWRNAPYLVALSSTRKRVSWRAHVRWYQDVMANPNVKLWIIEADKAPEGAGAVRVERKGCMATVSIYLLKQYTGRGWGPWALREACRLAFKAWPIGGIKAQIREDNLPSIKAFGKAGFVLWESRETPEGHVEMVVWAK